MDSSKLVESFAEFARSKNIDRPTVIRILEDVLRVAILNQFGKDDNFDIIVNIDKGDLQIWRFREIVEDNSQDIGIYNKVSLSDARKIETDFEVGEELAEEVKLSEFGRRIIMMIKQTLIQKVKELAKEVIYNKYAQLIGDIIHAEVNQVLNKEVLLLDDEGNELILPKSEQIPKDRFKKGDHVRTIIHKVEMHKSLPTIILSRVSPLFLERLFENAIPEIQDGLIAIKAIVREPGERAKVVVESYDDRIDPVGACVGIKGTRIYGITKELHNESIDIINYTENIDLYISRTLSPAKVSKIQQYDSRIAIYLQSDQISLAIGKGGQNIKLASKLINKEIDIYREIAEEGEEEDIYLKEFADVIDQWIIDELKNIGLDTARSVLSLPKEELEQRIDLEKETVDELYEVLNKELGIAKD